MANLASAHIKALRRQALKGDTMSIKTLCIIALLASATAVGGCAGCLRDIDKTFVGLLD